MDQMQYQISLLYRLQNIYYFWKCLLDHRVIHKIMVLDQVDMFRQLSQLMSSGSGVEDWKKIRESYAYILPKLFYFGYLSKNLSAYDVMRRTEPAMARMAQMVLRPRFSFSRRNRAARITVKKVEV